MYFSRESDLPLTIGLMIDTSMSQAKVLNSERSASFILSIKCCGKETKSSSRNSIWRY